MKLQTKLVLTVAPLAGGLALVGFVSLRTFDELGRSSQRILQDNYRSVLAAQRMKEAAERVDSAAAFRAAGRPDKGDVQAPPNLAAFEEELRVAVEDHGPVRDRPRASHSGSTPDDKRNLVLQASDCHRSSSAIW